MMFAERLAALQIPLLGKQGCSRLVTLLQRCVDALVLCYIVTFAFAAGEGELARESTSQRREQFLALASAVQARCSYLVYVYNFLLLHVSQAFPVSPVAWENY